jgi:calcineurin-like phosphoesterase family protein
MIWFTSDLHFGHANVIRYGKRPFANPEEMDAEIVKRWNDLVSLGDEVWVLGDVSFHKPIVTYGLLHQLHGKKHLVRGNHDRHMKQQVLDCFSSVQDYKELKVELSPPFDVTNRDGTPGKQRIVLSHYPLASWNAMHHGSWHLHGHSHGNYRPGRPDALNNGRILDVGVDVHNFNPICLEDVATLMTKKQFVVVDHHGAAR